MFSFYSAADAGPPQSHIQAQGIGSDDAVEGEIDSALGMKKYIRSPGLPQGSGFSTAAEFMVSELDGAMIEGRTTEGFRRLGALHTLEDYYSHSNFVELSLIELGHTKVFPWAGTPIVSSNPLLNGKFPIVTGMFGKHAGQHSGCRGGTPGEFEAVRGWGARRRGEDHTHSH